MKKGILLLLAVSMLILCACTGEPQSTQPPQITTQPATEAPVTQPPATQPTAAAPETQPAQTVPQPTETTAPAPVLSYVNPLNGMPMAQPYTGRPVAIMLNNIKSAMPMFGNSQADFMFEAIAEGGVTRFLGIYSDVSQIPKIGSVRSARKYYVDVALAFDPLYVHFGGSWEALNYLAGLDMAELECMKDEAYVFQDKDRLNAGYAREHTWFLKGERILQYAADRGISMNYDTERDYGYKFDDSVIIGSPANEVTAYFNLGSKPYDNTKYTKFVFDAEKKVYLAEQYKSPFVDAGNDSTLTFSNIVVLHMKNYLQDNGYRMTLETVGSGTGYYAANGQIVPIHWSRDSVTSPFVLTLEDGSPVTFTPGHTYFGLVPTKAKVEYSA